MTIKRRNGEHGTPFGTWLRDHPRLTSETDGPDNISATDIDMVIHRYKVPYDRVNHPNRQVNHLMIIEVKTHMASCSFAQEDSFKVLNRCLLRKKHGKGTCETYSVVNNRGNKIVTKVWGIHLLQFEGTNPKDSPKGIFWNDRRIDEWTLEELLRFEINPFTLDSLSDRRHHKRINGKWTS